MGRFGNVIYIDRNPENLDEGWAWVEVRTEDLRRFPIPNEHRKPRIVTKSKEITVTRYGESGPYQETHTHTYTHYLQVSSRGRSGTKKFFLNINDEILEIRTQKSLTIKAFCSWVRTWADPETKIITPGNKTISIHGRKISRETYFVYFLFNKDSNAVKIGRAKNLKKRLKSLQTSSPVRLKLLKSIQVKGEKEAHELERKLHQKFSDLRLGGEWFKAQEDLLIYLDQEGEIAF